MTIPPSLLVPGSIISEEELRSLTESLLSQMETGQYSEAEIEEAITAIVKTEKNTREFFITYLTDERSVADRPIPAVIRGLVSAPEIVAPVLVKNIVMSTAMVVHHRRNGDEEMAAKSQRVRSRATLLLQSLQLPISQELATQMRESLLTGEGPFQTFLQRWGYDDEQKQAMVEALQSL